MARQKKTPAFPDKALSTLSGLIRRFEPFVRLAHSRNTEAIPHYQKILKALDDLYAFDDAPPPEAESEPATETPNAP